MRKNNNKLIVTWVPGNHGAGGSTIANAVGIAMQHLTDKKTLIVNYGSTKSYMERYLENDLEMRFSMDYLKSFGECITSEHIKTYATPINEMLYIIPNSKISSDIARVGEKFNELFIDEALKAFDFVVLDIETGMNKEKEMFLRKADFILAVSTSNEIMLDELFGNTCDPMITKFLTDSKTFCLFNLFDEHEDIEKKLKYLNKKYGLESSFGISYDRHAYKAACVDRKFYSFMKKHFDIQKNNAYLPEQVKELCGIITEKLYIPVEEQTDNHRILNMILAKTRRWGEIDV